MNNSIDVLKTEVDNIQNSLNALKDNVSISETEKKSQAEALKSQADATEEKIQNEISVLESKTDAVSKRKKEEAETLLNGVAQINGLYESIINTESTDDTNPEDEEKGFFGRTKDWVMDQWDDMWNRDERKEHTGKNLLRGAGFLVTGGIVVVPVCKGVKKLWNRIFPGKKNKDKKESSTESKEENDKKESSWWKKGLGLLGIGTAGYLGFKHRDKIKQFGGKAREKIKGLFEKEKPLTFDEALKSVTSEVRNGKIKENPFRQHFEGGIKYDEGRGVILSYGEETKIDIKNKTIEGLSNITFPDYEQLIHAANIINFARRNFAGKCQSDTPFDIQSSEAGGDLTVHLANGENPEWIGASDSNLWRNILGAGGCAVGTVLGAYIGGIKGAVGLGATLGLGGVAAGDYLDNNSSMGNTAHDVASGTNLKRFKNCLNDQKDSKGNSLWPKRSEVSHDITSPIAEEVKEIFDEIIMTGGEGDGGRNLKCEQNRENPENFTISSYGQKINITLKGCTQTGGEHIDYSKITSIKIGKYRSVDWGDGLEIDFPHDKNGLKEAIRVANLTNLLRGNNCFAGNGGEKYPFSYGKYGTYYNLLTKNLSGSASFNLDMDTLGWGGKAIVSHNMLKTKFPTLFKDLGKQINKTNQDMLYKQAKGNKDLEGYESHYLRYLHQMRNEYDSQSYWINGQIKS